MTQRMKHGLAMLAVLLLAIATVSPATAVESEAAPIDLEAELARIIGLRSGGGVALTMRDGETQAGAVGFANADGDPMMVDTGFRTGWMTMGFIAAMVLQLVDEGRVDLDEPIATYLPDVPFAGDATVREILTMRTSLVEVVSELVYQWTLDPSREWPVDEIVAFAATLDHDSITVEGEAKGTGYYLLLQLVEALDGDFQTSFEQRIVEPLGLEGTSYPGSDLPDGLAAGWYPDIGLEGQSDIGGLDHIAGVRTTAPDIARFMRALAQGDIVSSELVMEVFSDDGASFTLGGIFPPSSRLTSDRSLYGWWGGEVAGYAFDLIVDPDTGDVAVLLVNNIYVETLPAMQAIIDSWDATGD